MVYHGYREDYFQKKLILTVAPTGTVHGKEKNSALPEQPEEIATAVAQSAEAGAAIAHIHARDEEGNPTKDPAVFDEIHERIRERTSDIIINYSSAGQFPRATRKKTLTDTGPPPEMASLDMGPMNFGPTHTAEHPRDEIEEFATTMAERGIKPELEVFHVGQLSEVTNLIDQDLIEPPYFHNLILGMQTGMPPHPRNLLNYVDNLPPESEWSCMAIGRHQLPLTTMAMVLGGHVRVGLEDNVFYRQGEKAESNAQLVRRAARIADELERPLASPAEAREMLGME